MSICIRQPHYIKKASCALNRLVTGEFSENDHSLSNYLIPPVFIID